MTKSQHKNVVFIMLDTLQFNYLGCYGNTWIQTPNIDRLAKQGTVFENAYTEGLPTIPCRRAMLTGRYTLPSKGWGPLDYDDTTVADIMWGRKVQTALVYDTAPMRMPKYGYSRSFDYVSFFHGHELDHYHHIGEEHPQFNVEDFVEDKALYDENGKLRDTMSKFVTEELKCYLARKERWRDDGDSYCAQVMKGAIDYIENKVDPYYPFMLWVDSFDPHEPWDPSSVWEGRPCPYDPDYKGKPMILPPMGEVADMYTEEHLKHIRALYAEKVTLVDKWVGKLLDKIQKQGLWDSTMIILTSDHGQPLGNGEHGHGIMRKCRPWPYEELAHIPMIVRIPGVGAGKKVKSFVQSVDVAPTILDWLGTGNDPIYYGGADMNAPTGEEMQGLSLIPLIKGQKEKLRDFAIAGYYGFSWSMITEDFSYIHWLNEVSDIDEALTKIYDASGGGGGKYTKSLQNEEMWTCTPGSEVEIPAKDELYNRKNDQFQLKNIIEEKPEVAKEMMQKLKLFIGELRTS
ncbi:MAG: sulfatase [Desulfopila sp.]